MITLVTVPELLSAQHALSIDCCIACPSGQQSSRYGLPKGRAYVIKCIAGYHQVVSANTPMLNYSTGSQGNMTKSSS